MTESSKVASPAKTASVIASVVEHYYIVQFSPNGQFHPHSMTTNKASAHKVAATVPNGYVLTLSREE